MISSSQDNDENIQDLKEKVILLRSELDKKNLAIQTMKVKIMEISKNTINDLDKQRLIMEIRANKYEIEKLMNENERIMEQLRNKDDVLLESKRYSARLEKEMANMKLLNFNKGNKATESNEHEQNSSGNNCSTILKSIEPFVSLNQVPTIVSALGASDSIVTESEKVIAYWLVKDLRPSSVVEETGMKCLFASLVPSLTLPTVSQLKSRIFPSLFLSLKNEIFGDFSTENGAAFSFDIWNNPTNGSMFASVMVNYYSIGDCKLNRKIFTTKEINARLTCSDLLLNCCRELQIDLTTLLFLPVVMDNPESMGPVSVGHNTEKIIIVPCLKSCLQEVVKIAFQGPKVVALLGKCRDLRRLSTMHQTPLNNDNPFVTSKHSCEDFKLIYWVYKNVDRLIGGREVFNSINFTEEEKIYLRQLTPMLEHIYQTLNVIEEKQLFSSVSMINTIVRTMNNNQFQPRLNDHQEIVNFKKAAKTCLSKIYPSNGQLHEIMWTATVFDPRFKTYQDPYESAILAKLKNLIINTDESSLSSKLLSENFSSMKHEDLHSIFGDDCIAQEPVSEVDRYLKEPKVGMDRNPINWWRDNSSRFPNLSKHALKYLCIPLANTESMCLYDRMKDIDPDEIDYYWFLNHNWK